MSLADEIGRLVLDETAETVTELMESTAYNRSALGKIIHERLASGAWERVWKRHAGRVVPAYRRAKKTLQKQRKAP